jgi:hypothetical protein
MNTERASIGKMPYRRRHDGISAIERHEETELWESITEFLNFLNTINNNVPLQIIGLGMQFLISLMDMALAIRTCVRNPHHKVIYYIITFLNMVLILYLKAFNFNLEFLFYYRRLLIIDY